MIDRLAWVWSIVVNSIDLWCDGFWIDVDDYRSITIVRFLPVVEPRNQAIPVFEARSRSVPEVIDRH
jgi:hypothetical protein